MNVVKKFLFFIAFFCFFATFAQDGSFQTEYNCKELYEALEDYWLPAEGVVSTVDSAIELAKFFLISSYKFKDFDKWGVAGDIEIEKINKSKFCAYLENDIWYVSQRKRQNTNSIIALGYCVKIRKSTGEILGVCREYL